MPIEFHEQEVRLTGRCGAEDALALADSLSTNADATIDLRDCEHLHAALLQTLFAYPQPISGTPTDSFLARWIVPALVRERRLRAVAS